jgi:hypothetical protein
VDGPGIGNNYALDCDICRACRKESRLTYSVVRFPYPPIWSSKVPNSKEIQNYSEPESLFNMAMASWTVVINCAGKMMVEFFSVAISAIVCSVRS